MSKQIFFTGEEYERLVKAFLKAADAISRVGVTFNEATRAMTELAAALEHAKENTDEIQIEE